MADALDQAILNDWGRRNAKSQPVNAPVKTQGRGGFLTSLISEGGAIGGGAQGAAIGSIAGPIGTLAGGAIGAGIGAFGGRLAENKIRDDEFKVGEAAKEGAISAVFGASPIKAAKGLTAASKAIGQGAEKAVVKEAAEKAISAPGVLSRLMSKSGNKLGTSAERLEARASGLGVGEKIAGEKLTPKETSRLLKVAIDEGMPLGHPETKAKFITTKLDDLGAQIDKNLTKANRAITENERTAVLKGFGDRFESNVTLKNSPTALREFQELQTGLADVNDLKGIVKAKRDLQSRINFNRNSASPDPVKEVVYDNAQKTLNELIGGISPEMKALNGRYGDLSKVQEGILNAAGKLSNSSESGSGGFWSKLLTGDTAQSAKSTIGRTGMAVDDAASKALGDSFALSPTSGYGAGNFATRILASKGVQGQPEEMPEEQSAMGDATQIPEADPTGLAEAAPTVSDDPYALENVQNSVRAIRSQGGSNKDVQEYLGIVKSLRDLQPEPKEKKPIKKTEGQRARDEAAQLTDEAIDQLDKGGINTGVISGKVERLKSIAGKGDPETLNFNTTISSLKAAIAKARAGTSFTPGEEKLLNQYAPAVGDSGQQLRVKLRQLQKVYKQAAEREYGTEYQPDEAVALGIE